jgi:hypothetical protein
MGPAETSTPFLRRWLSSLAIALLAAGCAEDPLIDDDDDDTTSWPEGIEVALSDVIPTVATLTWSPEDASVTEARVVFGRGGDEEFSAPLDLSDGEPFAATLIGMKAATEYTAWVTAETGDGAVTTEPAVFTTGPVPSGLPELDLEVTDDGSDFASGGFLLTSMFTGAPAPIILDGDGDLVWWYLEEDDSFQVNRTRLSRDGQWILYWSPNIHGLGPSGSGPSGNSGGGTEQKLVRVSLDGTEVQTLDLTDGHHDFVELSDGTLAYLEYDTRQVGVEEVHGDRIMEIDPSGEVVVVYTVWDDFEYEGEDPDDPGPPEGWTHANALRHRAEDDSYYVSLRAQDGILKIDRATGQLQWALGTPIGDFVDPHGETDFFNAQHGFQVLDGTLLVFNNGDAEDTASQVVEIAVDENTFEAEVVWEYGPTPSVFCPTLGDVHRFESGNTLAVFSTAGQVEEVTPDGDVVWRVAADLGGALGYGVWTETLYVED